MKSTLGFSIWPRNWRAYAESDSTYRRWPSAYSVSKARDDLPEPETPVSTTNLSRGISTSTPFRLCSRAPLMTILSLDIAALPGLLSHTKRRFSAYHRYYAASKKLNGCATSIAPGLAFVKADHVVSRAWDVPQAHVVLGLPFFQSQKKGSHQLGPQL